MKAFLMLVSAGAFLNGFKAVEPEEVAAELRMANAFYHVRVAGADDPSQFNRCLQTAVERDVITFLHEEKDATPGDGDVTVAMHWDDEADQARFYIARGAISYIPQPSLPPPPPPEE